MNKLLLTTLCAVAFQAGATNMATLYVTGSVKQGEEVVICANKIDAQLYSDQPAPSTLAGVSARMREADCVLLKSGVKYIVSGRTTDKDVYEVKVTGKENIISAFAVIRKFKVE